MSLYLDSGVLVKLYVPEPESARVQTLVRTSGRVAFTLLHNLELRNGIQAKARRGEITLAEAHTSLRLIEADLSAGRLVDPNPVWEDVFHRATALSDRFSHNLACRALDILHVALALTLDLRQMATTDLRQRELARAAGLELVPF